MNKNDRLSQDFAQERARLIKVAQRILGSHTEAEDAVQEAWIRLTRAEADKIENLGGWLTTVVARICLDTLRSRASRREAELDDHAAEEESLPDDELELAGAMGPALLLVIDRLAPAERIAFVLHDLFDLSFAEIAPILERTEEATRQLASRARRRVRGARATGEDQPRAQAVVAAFLQASREGKFEALLGLLHPEAVLRADEAAVKVAAANKAKGAPQFEPEIRGAGRVADTLKGKAAAALLAWVDGSIGATWAPGGKPVVVFRFSLREGKISGIEVVMDPQKLAQMKVEVIQTGGER